MAIFIKSSSQEILVCFGFCFPNFQESGILYRGKMLVFHKTLEDTMAITRSLFKPAQLPPLIRYDKLPSREVRFTRRNIFHRDKNRCQYCGGIFRQRDLNLDHVVPLSRGGKSTWDNVVCACVPCNTRKGDRTPDEAGMRMVRRPRKPAGHPMLRATWIGPCPDEWKTYLDEAYWNVELHDDVMLR